MANKSRSDMAEFKLWLQNDIQISRASSTVYASRVRKVLTNMNTLSQHELDRVMESLLEDNFHSHMSCWNHFRNFCSIKGITVPSSTVKKLRKSAARENDLPELVTLALLHVMQSCQMKPQVIVGLKWKHVEMKPAGVWWVSDPLDPTQVYMTPSNSMMIICDWANGEFEIEKERPLVPRAALSMVPMSKAGLKRSTSGRKRNRLQ